MTDILDDLKAPSYFCISLRKRAADEIKTLQGRLEAHKVMIKEREERVEKLETIVRDYRAVLEIRNKTIAERDKTIQVTSARFNRLQQRFHAIQKALDGE